MSFQKSSSRKPNALDFVYFDVCGPIEVESSGGNKYFVTSIDDASRKVRVSFVRTKYQAFQNLKKFHAIGERETRKPLKCLRTNNKGKLPSNEFEDYCSDHNIRQEKTILGNRQHNNVTERINRTMLEKVRSMFRMVEMPKAF